METRYLFNSTDVADLWHLLVEHPTTIAPEAPLHCLPDKTIGVIATYLCARER